MKSVLNLALALFVIGSASSAKNGFPKPFPQKITNGSVCQLGYVPAVLKTKKQEFPWAELKASQGCPVVEHITPKGTIICRDPQVDFDPEKCLSELKVRTFDGSLPEHMLVDMIVNGRLSGKQESYLDSIMPSKSVFPDGTHYQISRTYFRQCGSAPFSCIQVVFDDNHIVAKYRARYYEDPSTQKFVDSDWVDAISSNSSQPELSAKPTWEQIRDWADNPLVAHQTARGAIVCRVHSRNP